jgi:hypothetical protein
MKPSPFFIIASPRSGTTLLERLLNKHTKICIPPETAFFSLLRSRGLLGKTNSTQSIKEYVEWYLTSKPANLLGVNDMPNIQQLVLANAESISDAFTNLLTQVCEANERQRLGEKTPHHIKCIDYIMEIFPDSPVILMIRDGRAVVNSRMNQPNWETNLIGASRAWKQDVKRYERLISGPYADRVLVVKYEDLVIDPERILRETCTFLNEEYEPEMLQQDSSETTRFEQYYQQDWMVKSTKTIDPRCALNWQNELTTNQLALVENEIGKELQELGYTVERSPKFSKWYGLWIQEWVRHISFRTHRWLFGKAYQAGS